MIIVFNFFFLHHPAHGELANALAVAGPYTPSSEILTELCLL
jgi:hypothetical protein